jgi:small subunit ribosomal protein S4
MTKRIRRKFGLLNFYQEDFYGHLVLNDKNLKGESLDFKKVKINRLLYQRKKIYLENKKFYRIKDPFNKFKFYYRTDIVSHVKKKRKLSSFGLRLKLRQKLRNFANQMSVRQLRSYVKKVSKKNALFKTFLFLIESRIDFIIRRLNVVFTGAEGRQLINHGHVLINGTRAVFSNQQLSFFDFISFDNKNLFFNQIKKFFLLRKIFINVPIFLEVNYRILTATIVFFPKLSEVPYPSKFKPQMLAYMGKRFKN